MCLQFHPLVGIIGFVLAVPFCWLGYNHFLRPDIRSKKNIPFPPDKMEEAAKKGLLNRGDEGEGRKKV
jgi:hypothetical protein